MYVDVYSDILTTCLVLVCTVLLPFCLKVTFSFDVPLISSKVKMFESSIYTANFACKYPCLSPCMIGLFLWFDISLGNVRIFSPISPSVLFLFPRNLSLGYINRIVLQARISCDLGSLYCTMLLPWTG